MPGVHTSEQKGSPSHQHPDPLLSLPDTHGGSPRPFTGGHFAELRSEGLSTGTFQQNPALVALGEAGTFGV